MITKTDNTKDILRDLQKKQVEFVALGGQAIRSEQQDRCPKKSGYLANSITSETFVKEGQARSETGPDAEYAVYIEYGTGIYAVNGDGRKDPWWYATPEGKFFFTHGAKAQPFAEPGYNKARPKIDSLALRILKV